MRESAVLAVALTAAIGLSLWSAAAARHRRSVAGSRAFAWLMILVSLGAVTGVLHALIPPGPIRSMVAIAQYIDIAPVGVLWVVFAVSYGRWPWPPWALRVIGIAAAVMAAAALAVDYLTLLGTVPVPIELAFSAVTRASGWPVPAAVACVAFLVIVGAVFLGLAIRRYPPPYWFQTLAAASGALAPWAVPVIGAVGRWPSALVLTLWPLAFTASGLLLTYGLFRYRLFGLVPIARDMVVEGMEDGTLVLDSERRLIDFNRAAERYTGCTPASVGRRVDEVVRWWTAAVAEDRGAGDRPVVIRTEPGPRYFEVRVTPVRDPERRFAGWLVIIRDISARRRTESERYALERRLQEQQKSESLTVFAAGVAHDFNNLLTGVLGNADLIAMDAPRDSAMRQTAEAIIIGAQRAADLVSKMLAYAGEGRVVSERVDLDALARETVDLLSASVTHCTLRYQSGGPLPPVDADPMQIRQVVLNLITNAAEAVDEGGHVTVETGQQTLDRSALAQMTFGADVEPGRYVFVDVVDNGQGMTEDTASRMFDPFFSTRDQGRGLGLAAVRGIVRSHQAALRVTTAPGQGTRVRVWLSLTPNRRVRPATPKGRPAA